MRRRCPKNFTKVILSFLMLPIFIAQACQGPQSKSGQLVVAAYTAPREALREINRAFEKHWHQKKGEKIKVKASFLSSGAQSRAVRDGFGAQVVFLALEVDIDRLVEAGLVESKWREAAPHQGIVTQSVVAFAVRPGNPHQIKGWGDLLKPGLKLVTPNPKTSGGAQWNVLAAYGAALRGQVPGFEASPAGANAFLSALMSQVLAMDKGARDSILSFERGLGDVALSYENEILEGQVHGKKYELVIPSSTILIENPVALVGARVKNKKDRELAQDYLEYLFSDEAQEIFRKHGFRSVSNQAGSKNFQAVKDLFSIRFFGSWQKVMVDFFGPEGIFEKAMREGK